MSHGPVYLTLPQNTEECCEGSRWHNFPLVFVDLQTKCIKAMAWKWTLMCDKMSLFMSLTDILLDTFSALRKDTCCFGDDNIWLEHSGLDMEKCHLSSWEDARVGRLLRRQSCMDEICGPVDFLMFVTFVIPFNPFNNHWTRIPSPSFSATFGHLSEDFTFSTLAGHLRNESKGPKREQKAYNVESQNEMVGIKYLTFKGPILSKLKCPGFFSW